MSFVIINKLSLIAEVMTTILFLYGLYGEKFRIDYKEIVLISVDIIIMQGVDSGYLPQWMSSFIYLIIVVYCVWRFGKNLKKLIVNSALHIIFLSGLQLICFFLVYCLFGQGVTEEYRALATNVVMLGVCAIGVKKKKFEKIAYYFQRNDIIIRVIMLAALGILLLYIYMKKELQGLYFRDYLFPVTAILIISIMAVSWQSYKLKAKEKELELQAYKMYEESYNNLITEIRLKQHEFNNHINAVYSQHLICKTYEELVNSQREYCGNIIFDNRYEKLLRAGNSILIGFLYGKFIEAESKNIVVEYDIKCTELQTKLPMYKLIELVGNLLNNAMDALGDSDDKRLYFCLDEKRDCICIEVRNIGKVITVDKMVEMFRKGYSSKGENRGLGLYSIKKMGREYGFEVVCSNVTINNQNWVSFSVELKRST